ncbi:hypothetical protein LCGC14_1455540 [marine sediment metagenome]|uniref:Uncharacterized protein n=1 Tax=marine sediment metagenome TaxID=412755 RepID=A0A0F9K2S8_9ZZZZ
MPKIYLAYSYIFKDIKKTENDNLDDFKDNIREIIENICNSYGNDQEFRVETIIDPIFNIFKDFRDIYCLALLFEYKAWIEYGISWTIVENYIGKNAGDFFSKIPLSVWVKVGGKIDVKYIGFCRNNSYVQEFKNEWVLKINKPDDIYQWVKVVNENPPLVHIESNKIYQIFPKDSIVLPSKRGFSVDPESILDLKK